MKLMMMVTVRRWTLSIDACSLFDIGYVGPTSGIFEKIMNILVSSKSNGWFKSTNLTIGSDNGVLLPWKIL